MNTPDDRSFAIAIDWLLANEGEEGGEAEACKAVAKWLEDYILKRNIRQIARERGMSVKEVKKALDKYL